MINSRLFEYREEPPCLPKKNRPSLFNFGRKAKKNRRNKQRRKMTSNIGMEHLEDRRMLAADLTLSIDANNNLILGEDPSEISGNDNLTISISANEEDLIISDLNNTLDSGGISGVGGHGTNTLTIPLSAFTRDIIINPGSGDDTLTVDFTTDFDRNIKFDGGDQATATGDSLALVNGSVTTQEFNFTNLNDGNIVLDNTLTITYTGLEPISSTINAAEVILNYSDLEDKITVKDAGSGQTEVDSNNAEVVVFNNPTDLLEINAGDAVSNEITVESLASGYSSVDINGGKAGDLVKLEYTLDVDFAENKSLTIDAKTIHGGPDPNEIVFGLNMAIETSGTGEVVFTATHNIFLKDSFIETENGRITFKANELDSDTGDIEGVKIQQTSVKSTGAEGHILILGNGGDTGDYNDGVDIFGFIDAFGDVDAVVQTSGASITITGNAGDGEDGNTGVHLQGAKVFTDTGDIKIAGNGGSNGSTTSDENQGVLVKYAKVESTSGNIIIEGTGGDGQTLNRGVEITGESTFGDSEVTAGAGNIEIIGYGGSNGMDW